MTKMDFTLRNGKIVTFHPYEKADFTDIQMLNDKEGWNNLVDQGKNTRNAWKNSDATFVVKASDKVTGLRTLIVDVIKD